VQTLAPRLESFALIAYGELTKGCLVVGIDPNKEDTITGLKSKLSGGSFINIGDTAVMMADGLLKRMEASVGDTVVLIGQGYHGSTAAGKFPVKGSLRFGSPELNDKALFMPLPAAGDLYGAPGMITSYVLSVSNVKDLYPITMSVREKAGPELEVLNWEEMMPDIKQHIETDTKNMQVVHYILYLLICFGVFGTMLMMMAERKYEMGMLLAIGMKKSRLITAMVFESVMTVLGGCLLGVLASIPIVYYLHQHPIRIGGRVAEAYQRFGFEPVFPASVDPDNFISQGIIVLILGLVLSLYPVIKITRMEPVKSMKR
jgi:ABC-type lipoprotein release transport system permease subunit